MQADHSTWWRSGWVPDTRCSCPPPLCHSTFGGNWNLEWQQQLLHQNNVHNHAYHIENDEHHSLPSNYGGGETHHQQNKRWQWKHCCCYNNQKKWEECLIDIPQIKGGVHHYDEQISAEAEVVAVIEQPLKRQRHLMCSACIQNMDCLTVQQDILRGNGDGQAVLIHLIVKKRRHCKERTLFKKGLQEQSCKQ